MGQEQFSWRPASESWSVAENLIHLRLTNEAYLNVVNKAGRLVPR